MLLTAEQVVSLAPDAASATAGRGLAGAAKWQSAGQGEGIAWGEAKGSGAKPYQTVASLADGASRCSCPSRKFPCKHALGLLLRAAAGDVPTGEPPAWAAEWREKRGARTATKVEATTRTADPKSAERRWAKVLRGLDDCEAFLRDAVGSGILSRVSARGWDEMAARMVDAQAPGVARRLRRIGESVGIDDARAVAGIGSLGLLIEGSRRIESLGALADDVRTAVGIPSRREDADETIADVWDVLGSHDENEDRLWSRHTWLRGRESRRWALLVDFAPVGAPQPPRLPRGAAFAAEARFSPSACPLRAYLDAPSERLAPSAGTGGTWADALAAQADALALNPWIERLPVHLREATLARDAARWSVVDGEGAAFPLSAPEDACFSILARTGNAPREVFGEFDGESFFWLSDWPGRG